MSAGLLSQSFLSEERAENVYIPMVTWDIGRQECPAEPGVSGSGHDHEVFRFEGEEGPLTNVGGYP